MDKTIIEKVKKYTELVKTYIPLTKVVLYGSYANGTERENSDIDIAIIVDKMDGDYLELSAGLFNLTKNIDTRIEPILLNSQNDKSGFIESILKHGKIIYQNNKKAA